MISDLLLLQKEQDWEKAQRMVSSFSNQASLCSVFLPSFIEI